MENVHLLRGFLFVLSHLPRCFEVDVSTGRTLGSHIRVTLLMAE